MASRVNVAWQNWPGAPGVSTFFISGTIAQAHVDAIRAFFNALTAYLPTGLTIQVPASGDVIDDSTGNIANAWSVATTPVVVTGTSAAVYAGNSGAVIHWLTTGIINGRRLRGRTFLVPLVSTAFEANGSLTTSVINALTTAGNTLITALGVNFVVYSRPVAAHTKYDRKTGAGTAVAGKVGSTATVTGVRVPDLAVSLRSRRV